MQPKYLDNSKHKVFDIRLSHLDKRIDGSYHDPLVIAVIEELKSSEVEKIGDRIVKVQFIEYTGKRKKKVTHIQVKEAELDEMLKKSDKPVAAQFSMF